MSIRGALVVAAALAAPSLAHAFPCTVEGAKTLADCIDEVNPGEEVLLPARARIEVSDSVFPRKDVIIRSVSPDWPATLVHRPAVSAGPSEGQPIPYGPMLGVFSGISLTIQDVQVELFDGDPSAPATTVSRFALVDGELTLRNVSLRDVTGFSEVQPVPRPFGGYLAWVKGSGAKLILEGVQVENIDATNLFGGAIVAEQSAEVIVDGPSRFADSAAYQGAAIAARFGASVTVVDSIGSADGPPVFERNQAWRGGAIYVDGDGNTGGLQIVGGRFSDNSATDKGGHAALFDGEALVDGAVFEDGTAAYGAGLYVTEGGLTLLGSTLSGHVAAQDGGAVDVYLGSELLVSGTRFSDNRATRGGAIYATGISGPASIDSSLFCGGDAAAGASIYADLSPSSLGIYNNLFDGDGLGSGPAIEIQDQPVDLVHNTLVRLPGPAVRLQRASGAVTHTVFGEVDGAAALELSREIDARFDNVYHDPSSGWSAPVLVTAVPAVLGDGSVEAPLGLTGTRGDGELTGRCAISPHYLRPDSALLGGARWDDPDIRETLRGVFGGYAAVTLPGAGDPWVDDADDDGVVALWDCDDEESSLGLACPGDDEPGDTDDPGDTDVPDDPIGPGEPEEIFWYGSCSSVAAGGLVAPGLWMLVLIGLRRRRHG